MEENPMSTSQAFAVTNIEYFISVFYENSEYFFNKIIEWVDKYRIMDHKDIMIYLHDMLASKGYSEYAEEFAKKYDIQTEKT